MFPLLEPSNIGVTTKLSEDDQRSPREALEFFGFFKKSLEERRKAAHEILDKHYKEFHARYGQLIETTDINLTRAREQIAHITQIISGKRIDRGAFTEVTNPIQSDIIWNARIITAFCYK